MPDFYSKFSWRDWISDPSLNSCSLAAQGLWMRILAIAFQSEPKGHVLVGGKAPSAEILARLVGCAPAECTSLVEELERADVFSRGPAGEIVSRRMVRDAEARERARESGGRGGNPSLRRGKAASEALADAKAERQLATPAPESSVQPSAAPRSPRVRKLTGERSDGFNEFWERYPKKVAKDAAKKAWVSAVRRASAATIMEGLARHRFADEERFVPHAATWLSSGRWQDAPPEERRLAAPEKAAPSRQFTIDGITMSERELAALREC